MKKLLALVLALVMTLSLCVTSNAAYSDAADVDYDEAVEVMTAIGVFDGMDGKFNPDGILTREQAAKIVTYMLLGKTAADALVTIAAPFADVAADRWSAGSIAYCYNEGILAGVGNGMFAPTAELTGLAFAKMMLTALGYNAENEGLVGANWSINAAKLALTVGLTDDIEDISLAAPMSRELAAKMALNTLEATMVEYPNASVVKVGDVEVTTSAKASAVANNANVEKIANDNKMQFAEKYFTNLKVADDTDAFERPATTWTFKNKKVGTYADEADLSYTTTVSTATIYADLGLSKGIAAAKVDMYENGLLQTGGAAWSWDLVKGDVSAAHKIGGNGTLTEVFYDKDAGTVQIVKIPTYVGKVAAAYPETTTKDAYVTLDGVVNTGAGMTFETDGFKKDDIVRYTYSGKVGEGIQTMVKAEAVKGAMTTFTAGKKVTVAGTSYDMNVTCGTLIAGISTALDKDVTVYLDEYGYVLYVDAAIDPEYAVILAYVTGNALDSSRAKLLFTDGTVKTVNVAQTGGVDHMYTTGTTPMTSWDVNYPGNANGDSDLGMGDIVAYTVNSNNEYTITLLADARQADNTTKIVEHGKTAIKTATATNYYNVGNGSNAAVYANGDTIFLVKEAGKNTFTSYKGIANVPSATTTGNATVAVYVKTGTIAKVVFIDKTNVQMSSDNTDVILIKGDATQQTYVPSLNYHEFTALKNGEEITVKVDNTIVAGNETINEYTLIAGPIYNDKGVIVDTTDYANKTTNPNGTDLHYVDSTIPGGGVKATTAAKEGVIGLGSTFYAYTSDCAVYYIAADGAVTKTTAASITDDADDSVWFKLTDGLVSTVYIKVYDAPAGVPVTSSYSVTTALTAAEVTYGASKLTVDLSNLGLKKVAVVTIADLTLTADAYARDTNQNWVKVATDSNTDVDFTAGNSGAATDITGLGLTTGSYRITLTLSGGDVGTLNLGTFTVAVA